MKASAMIKHNGLTLSLLISLSTLPFSPGVVEDFVFDDLPAVRDNKDITDPSPWNILSHDYWGVNITSDRSHKSYRPLTTLTFRLQNQMTEGITAKQYKVFNIFLHSLNTLLLYLLLRTFSRQTKSRHSRLLSLVTSGLFACHPVHVEPVVSIVGRADLLYSTLFLLSSLLCLSWQPEATAATAAKFLTLSTITFLSMFCKEQGILFLLFWFVLDLIKTILLRKKVLQRKFLVLVLYILLNLIVLSFIRMSLINFEKPSFQKGDNPAAFHPDIISRLLTFNYIYCWNFLLLLMPNWLCFDWSMGCMSILTIFDWRILILFAFFLISIILAVKIFTNFRKFYIEIFAIALSLIPFLLSTNIFVYVGFVIAERNLYLSVAGTSLLVCQGLVRLQERLPRLCSSSLLLLLFSSFLSKSVVRSSSWATELSLFKSGLSVCPSNAKVHYNVAKKLADQNRHEEAVTFYKESIRLEPQYEHALNNLANLLKLEKQFEEAETLLVKATVINPKFSTAHMNLGIVRQAVGKFQQAEEDYLRALGLRRSYPDAEFNLGNLYLKTRKHDLAEKRFRMASQYKHELAFANLIILLDEMGRLQEAQDVIKAAIETFPDNPDFYFQKANCLGKQGNYEESEAMYLRAISLRNSGLYWSNLGVLYHRSNQKEKAVSAYKTALLLDKNIQSARANLEKLQ